jgi:hypothetical protein
VAEDTWFSPRRPGFNSPWGYLSHLWLSGQRRRTANPVRVSSLRRFKSDQVLSVERQARTGQGDQSSPAGDPSTGGAAWNREAIHGFIPGRSDAVQEVAQLARALGCGPGDYGSIPYLLILLSCLRSGSSAAEQVAVNHPRESSSLSPIASFPVHGWIAETV